MPNIASILKEEITRVARKAVRTETETLKKSSGQYRSDIAALKRRVQSLERQLARLGNGKVSSSETDQGSARGFRFSAKGLAKQRQRLGLSAAQAGALMGVSGQSVYHWETGKSRPRASQLPAIAQLRKLGKREAAARLNQVEG